MNINRETEIARKVAAHFTPRVSAVVAPHHVPMFLHEERVRLRRMHRDPMNTMTNLCVWIGHELRMQTTIDRFPGFTPIIGPERARRGDRDEDSLRIFR